MKGTLINAAAIAGGSLFGLWIKQGIPEKYQQTVMQGLGLTTLLIGVQMAFKTQNILIVILSLVIGALMGEWLAIDKRLQTFGDWLTNRLGSRFGNAGDGFITASLVYCVGAMAIVGPIQEGMTGDAATLYAKAMLDGVAAVVFASTMGIGVALSAISVLLYQGSITLLSGQVSSLFSEAVVREMTAVGGTLILAIALLILEIKKMNVANLLPAIPAAAIITLIWL